MQNRKTADVIAAGERAISNYERIVKKQKKSLVLGLISGPGKGVKDFRLVLEKSKSLTPEEAVYSVYMFYRGTSETSRLGGCIQRQLFELFKIDYQCSYNIWVPEPGAVFPGDILEQKMQEIAYELGIAGEKDELIPSVRPFLL